MLTTTRIVLFFLLFILLILLYKIFKKDDHHIIPPPPPTSIQCGVLDPSTIKSCDIKNLNNICKDCDCSGQGDKMNCMSCQLVDEQNPYYTDISKDKCTSPFVWDDRTGQCKLSNGTYCLPVRIQPINCNPYTGRKVLIENTNNEYEWKCICKDTTQFTGSTCSDINICGMEGTSARDNNGIDSSTGRYLVHKNEPTVYWNDSSNWDPIQDGVCICRTNEIVDNNNHTCSENGCGSGNTPKDKQTCICREPHTIDCSLISQTIDPSFGYPYYNGVCSLPSCVPDPCGGPDGQNGHYDVNNQKCVCSDGYHLVIDGTSMFGQSCKKICENNDTCGGTGKNKRGDCYFFDASEKITSFTIVCTSLSGQPYCDGTGNALISCKEDNKTYYLTYTSQNNQISFMFSTTGNLFGFIPYCERAPCEKDSDCATKCDSDHFCDVDTSCPKKASAFSTNAMYYLTVNDHYVDIINGLLISSDEFDKKSKDDQKKLLIKLVSGTTTDDNIGNHVTNITTKIYNPYDNSFFNKSDDKLIFSKAIDNSERCNNCDISNGYKQDQDLLCKDICFTKGSGCDPENNKCCNSCEFGGVFNSGYYCT